MNQRRWLAPSAFLLLQAVAILWSPNTASALEYPTNESLTRLLKKLAGQHRKILRVESAAQSIGKRDIWRAELGSGKDAERAQRPAMLLVAGIEGDLAGTASALAWMERLLGDYEKDDSIRKLLDTTTIYVFPRLNPDAAERFFAQPRMEVGVNQRPVDDDHDGLMDEDGPDDLDGDGLITWMRVEDPEGEYILDPVEPRLLIKADRTKGERGAWRLYSEGRDDDKDDAWNEDAVGGVNFNRNFPYNYRFFAPGSGQHPVSEVETRMLADFVVAHPHIGMVFTFGAADNLVQTPKSEAGGRRPPTAIQDGDLPYYREFGKAWRDALGLKKELQASSEPGTFSDWMYFHRGRLSLAARAWSPALALAWAKNKPKDEGEKSKNESPPEKKDEKADSAKAPAATKNADEKKADPDSRNEEDRAFLKWLDENAPQAFVPWKEFKHPDFPGKKVQVGGFAPFARTHPPEKLLEELAGKQAKFLTDLAGKLPRLGIRKVEARHLGESVYEVTIQLENTGYLPTVLAQGGVTREVYPTRATLKLDDAAFLSGTRTAVLGPIEGSGGMKEVRWVVHAKGRKQVEVEVISMLSGTVQATIELKEEK